MEKLADYCDDMINPQNKVVLVAKRKQPEEKKQVNVGDLLMASVPMLGAIPKEFLSSKNNPNRIGTPNGPIKALREIK